MNFSHFVRSLTLLSLLASAGISRGDTVAAGDDHSVLVRPDGTVWTWGYNYSGQLGINSTVEQWVPIQVDALDSVSTAAAGALHTLALKLDGRVWAWGRNYEGELGDGTNIERHFPVQVKDLYDQPLDGIIAVAAGYRHSLALKDDGTVWAWGDNWAGEIGNGNYDTPQLKAVQVKDATGQNLSEVVAIAAGDFFSMALKSNGTVWAWGLNNFGQLGVSSSTYPNTAVPVQSGIAGVADIGVGYGHAAALTTDGSVWSWGYDGYGQLGNGNDTTTTYIAQQAHNLENVTAIAVGQNYTLAIKSDATVSAWGENRFGQLGDGSTTGSDIPIPVKDQSGVTDLSGVTSISGGFHSLAVLPYKGVLLTWGWGLNFYGQLGDGTWSDKHLPVLTHTPFDADEDGLLDWQEYVWNSDPLNTDTNGDGLLDGEDVQMGFDPSDLDVDEDGISNTDEYALGTNVFWNDTDGDGVIDGEDAFPLDPTRSDAWPPDPNDHTPPVITITFPTTGITPL